MTVLDLADEPAVGPVGEQARCPVRAPRADEQLPARGGGGVRPALVDVDAVGWILMGVGLVSILLSLLFWQSWAGPGYWSRRRTTYVDDGPPPPTY